MHLNHLIVNVGSPVTAYKESPTIVSTLTGGLPQAGRPSWIEKAHNVVSDALYTATSNYDFKDLRMLRYVATSHLT